MFDGVPEQLHQFIASSNLSLISSSLHQSNVSSSSFDPFTSNSPQLLIPPQPGFLHTFTNQSQQPHRRIEESNKQVDESGSNNRLIDIERSSEASWSNDEVLALLRIRSSLDNWFPESNYWEHVSRKLEEVGYRRSAEKCEEKFEEEESRYLSNINYNKSHKFFNEFEDVNYTKKLDKSREEEGGGEQQDKDLLEGLNDVEKETITTTTKEKEQSLVDPLEDLREKLVVESKLEKKRKRVKEEEDDDRRFEILKGFCEEIVRKMMAQQEETHLKLIEDMVNRDEEKIAREEAWKKQEMDRIDKELEIRAHEQAIANDRQATLIKFLKSFTSLRSSSGSSSSYNQHRYRNQNKLFKESRSNEESPLKVNANKSTSSLIPPPNPNNHQQVLPNHELQKPTSNPDNPNQPITPQSPNSPTKKNKPLSPISIPIKDGDDIGKRWPRDEVFALINLRCNLHNNTNSNSSDPNHNQDKEGQARIPLWERISQGMLELGYKRSAKRCKEKWENINKYFRKTKHVNKKRSLDSRTCPYFHQLSTLYDQGTLVAPPSEAGNHPSALAENQQGSSQDGSSSDSTLHVGHDQQGEKILVQVPTFDFDF